MTNGRLTPILRHIRALVDEPTADGTDAELLERFAARRDEVAFAALVQRYGRLVFGVCRRVLRCEQDAEDAFQATFLVLAHKAPSIRKRTSAASFLFGVAHRVALRAKADAARRRDHERRKAAMPATEPHDELVAREHTQVIVEELGRLPERYRAPLVLCCLADRTQEEAARELGWPAGSMSRWLTRGKEMLRKRLLRRGVAVSAALLGTALADLSAEAAPPALTSATIQTAVTPAAGPVPARVAALTQGVLRTMMLTKFRAPILLLVAVVAAAGTAVLALQTQKEPDDPNGPPPPGNVAQAPPGDESPPKGPDRKDEARTEYVKAEVTVLVNQQKQEKPVPLQLTVTDPDQVNHLAKFFPEMGQGKVSSESGKWTTGIVVKFHRAAGDPVKVSVHWGGEVWTEGKGDWDTRPGLWDYLGQLISAEDVKKLQGTWKLVSLERHGEKARPEEIDGVKWFVRGDRITHWQNDVRIVRNLRLYPDERPKGIDLTRDSRDFNTPAGPPGGTGFGSSGGMGFQFVGTSLPGIYSLEGDDLKICETAYGNVRPGEFATEGTNRVLYVLKREKEAKPDADPKPPARPGAWSKPVNGLSGRLLVAFEDLKPGLRHAVTLELRNVSETAGTPPVAVLNQPKLVTEVLDADGKPLAETGFPMSGPIPAPQWGVIPLGAYLGFRVDMQTVGVPPKDQALLAVGGKTWGLKPGTYVLRARLVVEGLVLRPPGPQNQWTGEMDLPPVEVVVTKEQVEGK